MPEVAEKLGCHPETLRRALRLQNRLQVELDYTNDPSKAHYTKREYDEETGKYVETPVRRISNVLGSRNYLGNYVLYSDYRQAKDRIAQAKLIEELSKQRVPACTLRNDLNHLIVWLWCQGKRVDPRPAWMANEAARAAAHNKRPVQRSESASVDFQSPAEELREFVSRLPRTSPSRRRLAF